MIPLGKMDLFIKMMGFFIIIFFIIIFIFIINFYNLMMLSTSLLQDFKN